MPVSEISPFREGKDQRSDSPTRGDVSCSNRKVRDFAIRQDAYQYTARNDLSQQGVEEQAYERELARKGKKLAVPDETSWHSDTSSGGYSSGSDFEIAVLKAGWSENEKLVLTDKSGLLGGGNLGQEGARAASELLCDLYMLGKCLYGCYKSNKAKQREERFADHIASLRVSQSKVDRIEFVDFRREYPNCSTEDFRRWKGSLKAGIEEEIEKEFQIVTGLGLGAWDKHHKKNCARHSDAGASTSGS